jgi:hypothetical protein
VVVTSTQAFVVVAIVWVEPMNGSFSWHVVTEEAPSPPSSFRQVVPTANGALGPNEHYRRAKGRRQALRFEWRLPRAGQSGKLVGVAGFEPVTLLVPNEVRYQTTLRSDLCQPANLTPSPYHGAGGHRRRLRQPRQAPVRADEGQEIREKIATEDELACYHANHPHDGPLGLD